MATQENTPVSPELSVATTDAEAPVTAEITPYLYLEIRRGRTGYPQRPVLSKDFLIGSGPACDLRLGGDDIPEAHSLLLVRENEVRVQWLAEPPALVVNGEQTHESPLKDGDRIHIGRFEFIVHGLYHAAAAPEPSNQAPADALSTSELLNLVSAAKTSEPGADLSELSIDELAERLETEDEAVKAFDGSVSLGEAALLYAVAQRAEELAAGSDQQPDEPADAEILEELERVITQLSGFSAELDERATRLARQETTQAEAAELLLDAQKELAAQLERFHEQVAQSQEASQPKFRKAA